MAAAPPWLLFRFPASRQCTLVGYTDKEDRMPGYSDHKDQMSKRLRRIEGQVRGLQ